MTWAQIGALLVAAGGLGATIAGLIKVKEWFDDRRKSADAEIKAEARREYEDSIKDSFIFAVATNHLPHVFAALELIAAHLGIKLPDPPPIQFLPFEPRDGEDR